MWLTATIYWERINVLREVEEAMETKAILEVYGSENQFVNLYIPHDLWKELVDRLHSNRLTVVLRMTSEYSGDLRIGEANEV